MLPSINFCDNSLKQLKHASDQINTEDTLNVMDDLARVQAALEIAYSNQKGYLPGIPGTIADPVVKFDKTFPILNCDACFRSPKIAEIDQQHMIGLQTNSNLISAQILWGEINII